MHRATQTPAPRAHRRPFSLLLVALLAVLAMLAGGPGPSAGAAPTPRPNVIFVLTDDQTVAELSAETMPQTVKALGTQGTTFTNSVVSAPLCCPSRAGFLTGDYPHNSGVYDNEPGYGALIDKGSIVYSWLQAAGYRTGHVGRYLLNYDRPPAPGADYETDLGFAPPPGLDDWYGYVGSQTQYFNATFSDNGVPVGPIPGKAGYSTTQINHQALDFVRAARSDPRPFFLMVAHLAPHSSDFPGAGPCGLGAYPKPQGKRDYRPFADVELPRPPSFNEKAIGDKPNWVETRPHLGRERQQLMEQDLRCSLASLPSVDRGVGALVRELRRDGELDNTMIVFTSDNGYFFGEHRIFLNKVFPYEEALRVPLLVRMPETSLGPKATRHGQPPEVSTPVNQLDLTATIMDLAGAPSCTAQGVCRTLDGRSLRPLLNGRRPGWSSGRGLLFQLGGNRTCGEVPPKTGLRNYYDGIRTKRFVYIELNRVNPDTGVCDRPEYELYDLKEDPYQLKNLAVNPAIATPPARQAGLAARLAALRDCSGIPGRDAPTGRPFCD